MGGVGEGCLKLLHVIPTYVPAYRYGGPVRSVYGLAEALGRTGAEVSVFTTDLDGSQRLDVPVGQPVRYPHHRAWYFPVRGSARWHRSPALARALAREVGTFELVHLHSLFLQPTWAARRSAQVRGIPYLVSPRGMLEPHALKSRGAWRKRLALALWERRTLQCARRIVVTSPLEAEGLRQMGLALAPLAELPNGIDPHEWEAPPRDAIESPVLAALAAGDYLLYLGRIHPKKGLDTLLEAVRELEGMRLLIVGPAEGGYREKLIAGIRARAGAARIEWLESVSGPARVALLRASQALVLPSRSENFGNVVVEAMACAVPVVTTGRVGAAFHVERAGAGWVVPAGSVVELRKALLEVLTGPEEARRRGRLGCAYVERELTWDRIAERALELYGQVLREAKR